MPLTSWVAFVTLFAFSSFYVTFSRRTHCTALHCTALPTHGLKIGDRSIGRKSKRAKQGKRPRVDSQFLPCMTGPNMGALIVVQNNGRIFNFVDAEDDGRRMDPKLFRSGLFFLSISSSEPLQRTGHAKPDPRIPDQAPTTKRSHR